MGEIDDLMKKRGKILIQMKDEKDPQVLERLKKQLEDLKNQVRTIVERNVREYWETLPPINDVKDVPDLPKPLTKWHFDKLEEAGAIPKRDLVDGATYLGKCRNADEAVWHQDKNVFTYLRNKFMDYYLEDINHYEDDDGYDLFVPIKRLK